MNIKLSPTILNEVRLTWSEMSLTVWAGPASLLKEQDFFCKCMHLHHHPASTAQQVMKRMDRDRRALLADGKTDGEYG